jgi:hypothetical protein
MQKTIEIPIQTRLAEVGEVAEGSRTVPITWTTGAAVKRVDWWNGDEWLEELSCDPAAVRMGRMNSGAPLLDTHNRYSVSGVLGVVENAKVDGQCGTADVRFSRRAEVEPILQDVKDKIIRNISVGYTVYRFDDVSTPEDIKARVRRMRAMDWEPAEVSLVPIGADAGAGVRAESPKHKCVIEFAERSAENPESQPAGQAAPPAQRSGGGIDHLRRIQLQAERE